jgi:hypothetical protein
MRPTRRVIPCLECDRLWADFSAAMMKHARAYGDVKAATARGGAEVIQRLTTLAESAEREVEAAREAISGHQAAHDTIP